MNKELISERKKYRNVRSIRTDQRQEERPDL